MRPVFLLAALLALAVAATGVRAEDPKASPSVAPKPVVLMKVKDMGDIEIELYPAAAPMTVENFIELAEGRKQWTHPVTKVKSKKPFFDGLTFHRVIPDFMLQGGDPAANGTGGPGYFFKDEINAKALGLDKLPLFKDPQKGQPHPYIGAILDPRNPRLAFQRMVIEPLLKKLKISPAEANQRLDEWQPKLLKLSLMDVYENQGYKYDDTLKAYGMKKGYIAMANSGPNTNGSQFFINLKDNDYLTGKHTVFGKVVKGMDVVTKIGAVRTNARDNKPIKPVVIDFVRIRR